MRPRARNVRATARRTARAPRVSHARNQPRVPGLAVLPAAERQAFDDAVKRRTNRLVRLFRQQAKRVPTRAERAELHKIAVQGALKQRRILQARTARALSHSTPPPVSHPRHRDLVLGGAPKKSTGSTGLGGNLRRRVTRSVGRKFKLVKPHWIDPFPWIPGTVPEKIIFEALYRRRVYFIFHGTPEDFHGTDLLSIYAPTLHDFDFLLPEYRVVIDPYSEYHHSQPDSIVRDTQRRTVLYAMGWNYYTPWATQVEKNGGNWVLDQIDELRRPATDTLTEKDRQAKAALGYRLGAALGTGAFSVGIANRKRRRPPSLSITR